MMTSYKPPELSQCDVELLSELILPKRLLAFSKNDPTQKIRFLNSSPQKVAETCFSIPLKINQQKIHLTLQPTLESLLMHRLSEFGGLEAIPEEFRTAMRAFCSREIITSLENFLQLPISLWEGNNSQEAFAEGKILDFEVLHGDSHIEAQGQITLPYPLLKRIISFVSQQPPVESARLARCSLDGELIIGNTQLSFSDWKNLTPGALVFLEEPCALASGEGHFLLKKSKKIALSFDVKQLQALLLPLAKASSSGFTPAAPLEGKAPSNSEQNLAGVTKVLTVELAFSVGPISLTIDEVLQLSKTKMLPQPIKIFRPLKILAQGESIGTGELVEIHGQHAIFITQLHHDF